MKCRLLKLRSGEEIVCDLNILSKTKYKLINPYMVKTITMMDPINGLPCDITVLKDWLNLTKIKTITIPSNHIISTLMPTDNMRALYKKELTRTTDPQTNPENITNLEEKDLGKMLENLFDEMFSARLQDANASQEIPPEENTSNSLTPEEEYKIAQDLYNKSFPPRKRRSKNQPMIQLSMVFPPEVLIELMETGLLNTNDIISIAKEVKSKLKYTGDERHRPDYGNKASDWNPDIGSDEYK